MAKQRKRLQIGDLVAPRADAINLAFVGIGRHQGKVVGRVPGVKGGLWLDSIVDGFDHWNERELRIVRRRQKKAKVTK